VNHEIRRDFNSETNDGGYNPIIEETAAGASRSNAWHAHRNSAESYHRRLREPAGPSGIGIRGREPRGSNRAPAADRESKD
jgi:hypothetical protein